MTMGQYVNISNVKIDLNDRIRGQILIVCIYFHQ